MNLRMIIRVAFRALVRNKMRAMLTMLGIIIGVAAVIAMVSIGQGAQASVQAQIESIGTNLLFLSAGAQNVGGVRSGTGDSGTNTLTVEDLEAIRREVPSVSMVTPTINSRSQLVAGNMNWNTQIQGVSEQYPDVRKWTVQSGEFFGDTGRAHCGRVIVIGQTMLTTSSPERSGGPNTARGEPAIPSCRCNDAQGSGQQGRDQDDTAFAPYTTVQKRFWAARCCELLMSPLFRRTQHIRLSSNTDLLRRGTNFLRTNQDFTVKI